jgi:hypothetical protein
MPAPSYETLKTRLAEAEEALSVEREAHRGTGAALVTATSDRDELAKKALTADRLQVELRRDYLFLTNLRETVDVGYSLVLPLEERLNSINAVLAMREDDAATTN